MSLEWSFTQNKIRATSPKKSQKKLKIHKKNQKFSPRYLYKTLKTLKRLRIHHYSLPVRKIVNKNQIKIHKKKITHVVGNLSRKLTKHPSFVN